jgi:uncharacterized protein (UPF0335 family)
MKDREEKKGKLNNKRNDKNFVFSISKKNLNEEGKHYSSEKFKDSYQQYIIDITWGQNLPMIYLDDNGRIVEHWKDGKIKVLKEKILPCASKVKFATEKDALFSLEKITKTSKRDVIPIRAYHCNCGSWHLTSKTNKFSEQVTPYVDRIKELESEVETMKSVILDLTRKNNKEENVKVKADARVIQLQKQNKVQNETIARLRKDVSDLIVRLNDKDRVNELEHLSLSQLLELKEEVVNGFKNKVNDVSLINWFKIYQKVFSYTKANKDSLMASLGLVGEYKDAELVKYLIDYMIMKKQNG